MPLDGKLFSTWLDEDGNLHFGINKPPIETRPCRRVDFNGPGFKGIESGGAIQNGVFSQAERNHDRCCIDLLALGKPYGDIFNPDHWMYDSIRDNFGSVLSYADFSNTTWEIWRTPMK